MPKFTTDTKFLSHTDLSDVTDTIVTIKGVDRETVGQGAQASEKWIVYFRELKKGLALNKTNGKMICHVLKTEEMDEWIGRKIALYVKDDVEYQGEIVSAIRVRSKVPGTSQPEASAPHGVGPDELVEQIAAAPSIAEVFALKRQIMHSATTDHERAQLNALADQRMQALNAAARMAG